MAEKSLPPAYTGGKLFAQTNIGAVTYYRPACSSRAGILDSQPRDMMWTPWQ